ncbi:MAG TPA: glycosyltransferase family 2 protein [Opitutaceae bacterium]|jgi:glycosyltransferase involved in cell wall biosynthesis|nr:glycosyltransferase family 2 protein [Opitutaceae bacterium]
MTRTDTYLVLIPAYNPGRLLAATVEGALAMWDNVWVIVDGSTDGSHLPLVGDGRPGLKVVVLARNEGKGGAVLAGARLALEAGFTHALVMDADGQHPAARIPDFMAASQVSKEAVICGRPVFGPEAPKARLYGRKLSVGLVHLETSGKGAADPLFGFRVYPLAPLVAVLGDTQGGRRYDFDPEVAVRLAWAGTPAVNLDAECVYVPRASGGVSHFRYLRDNLTMISMHTRLILAVLSGNRGSHAS